MNESGVRTALRTIAMAIALAAIVDPAITAQRAVKPVVVVTAPDSMRDARLADRVARVLDERFTIARSPIAGASASVVVGARPLDAAEASAPAFVVARDSTQPTVAIERLEVPTTSPSDARIPAVSRVTVRGAAGRSLELSLRAGGSIVDRTVVRLTPGDTTVSTQLSFVPTDTGAAQLRVTASIVGANELANADAVVMVREQRWNVLFFDPRPSWQSTFVRRAIERDSRFTVASRVVTSRDVSTVAGRAPNTLRDRDLPSSFDAIVVGAPDALSQADVAGLEVFMRRRGGSVVLLLDGRTPGAHDRLMDAQVWGASSTTASRLALAQDDSSTLRSTETVWPNPLPPGATTVVSGDRPEVWQTAIGAGRLIVSGALDAWRFRDPANSAFDRFWRTLVADAAASAPPPLAVTASSSIARPGELVDLDVVVRDVPLPASASVARASVAATLEPRTPVVLWPDGDVGHFSGRLRAPREAATYRVVVTGVGGSTGVPLVVTPDAHRTEPWSPALLEAWAVARGGQLVQAGDIGRLADLLSEAVHPPSRLVTWHPLRSAWWIVPFVLALSGEWWLRRRRGLR